MIDRVLLDGDSLFLILEAIVVHVRSELPVLHLPSYGAVVSSSTRLDPA